MTKYHVKKGDLVEVLSGDDKGKRGRVLKVLRKKNRVIVEGVNIIYKHRKPRQEGQNGIIETEGSIHISNVLPICPDTDKPTRVGRIKNSEGKLVRISKKAKKLKGKTVELKDNK